MSWWRRAPNAGLHNVPFFPLGGFEPYKAETLDAVAAEAGATPMQVALVVAACMARRTFFAFPAQARSRT